jgi:HD-GYP domain-containing protein (c-di-GMP phosphodiesterase class II)
MQRHTYFTRVDLQGIERFADITEWAANHHEKLDGSGYPNGRGGPELDHGSRLLAVLDQYQALTEDRPYRSAVPHDEAVATLRRAASAGLIESSIVEEAAAEFG